MKKSVETALEQACLSLAASAYAHDIAQPLQKIVAEVETFEDLALTGELTEIKANEFRARFQVILKDINSLTAKARSYFRQFTELPIESIEVPPLLERLKQEMDSKVPDIEIHFRPESSKKLTLSINPGLGIRAIRGFLNYASEVEKQNQKTRLECRVQGQDAAVSFSVRLSNPPPKDPTALFKFFSGEASSEPLAMARAIAVRVGGNLWFSSRDNEHQLNLTLPGKTK